MATRWVYSPLASWRASQTWDPLASPRVARFIAGLRNRQTLLSAWEANIDTLRNVQTLRVCTTFTYLYIM